MDTETKGTPSAKIQCLPALPVKYSQYRIHTFQLYSILMRAAIEYAFKIVFTYLNPSSPTVHAKPPSKLL